MVNFLTPPGAQGGILAPQARTGIMMDPIRPAESVPAIPAELMDMLSIRSFNRTHQQNFGVSPWEVAARSLAAVAIDTVDSVWSTPLNPFGERGDVWSLAPAEQQEFFERNRNMIEVGSAVVGGIGAAVFAEALIVPRITAGLMSSTAITGSRAWQVSQAWNANTARNAMIAQQTALEAGRSFGLVSSSAGRQFLLNRAAAGAAVTTRTLPFDYAIMWNNEAFNSGELSTEAFWTTLGAATGAGIGLIQARRAARVWLNAAPARQIAAEQYSMAGITNELLAPVDSSSLVTAARAQAAQHTDTALPLADSTYLTFNLTASRANDSAGASPEIAARSSSLRAEHSRAAQDGLGRMLNRGITGVQSDRVVPSASPEVRAAIRQTAAVDPYAFYGATELGLAPRGSSIRSMVDGRTRHLQRAATRAQRMQNHADPIQQRDGQRLAAQVTRQQREQPFAMVGGSWMNPDSPLVNAAQAFADRERQFMSGLQIRGGSVEIPPLKAGMPSITLTPAFTPNMGKNVVQVEALDHVTRFGLYAAAEQLISKLAHGNSRIGHNITERSAGSWFALDMVAEMQRRNPNARITYDPKTGLSSTADVVRASTRLKAQALLQEVGATGAITAEHRLRYNLPAPTAMESMEDPTGTAFRHWLVEAAKTGGTADELAEALKVSRVMSSYDLRPANGLDLPRIDGEMFAFNRGEGGEWLRPTLGYFTPRNHLVDAANRGHADALQRVKAETMIHLMRQRPDAPTPISEFVAHLVQTPAFQKAHAVNELIEGQSTGGGLSSVGQVLAEFLPQRNKHRDNITTLSAGRLPEMANQAAAAAFKDMAERNGMQDVITLITSSNGASLRAELNQFYSIRPGWDIDAPVSVAGGAGNLKGFVLRDTEINRRLLGVAKVQPGTLMPNLHTNKPVVVSDQALNVIERMTSMMDTVRNGTNAIRQAKGLRDIGTKTFFAPSPDTRGQIVGFVQRADGQVVPGRTIVASTQAEYERLSAQVLEDLGPGHTIRNRQEFSAQRDVWDEIGIDWVDHGHSTATSGLGSQRGGLTGTNIRDTAFTDALGWVERQLQVQHMDAVKTLLRDQIQIARMRGAAEKSARGDARFRSIFDEYEHAVTGEGSGFAQSARVTSVVREAEKHIDSILQSDAIAVPARWVVDQIQRIGMPLTKLKGATSLDQIQAQMAQYAPFENVLELMESRGVKAPLSVRRASQALNRMATTVILRWDQIAHPTMNMLGLIPTMASQLRAGGAPASVVLNVAGRPPLPVIDSMRIIRQAMGDWFGTTRAGGRQSTADWQHMVRNGDASQSAFEYHRAHQVFDSNAGMNKFLRAADRMASTLSETSENWSRQMSHFVGLRLADYQGIRGMEQRHTFAREFANASIADYTPTNRPELFTTAFGSIFGLFQSYTMSQWTKMFNWVEQGQLGPAAVQAIAQMSLFGVAGTYGSNTVFSLYDTLFRDNDTPGLMDNLYSRLGPTAGNAVAHGGISAITGIALYTRGDINLRLPGAGGQLPPGLDVAARVARIVTTAVEAALPTYSRGELPTVLEAIQREMPNRVLRGIMGQLQGGDEVDRSGNITTETRTWLDAAARMAGVRSSRQQAELEAYYAGRADMERDGARMESVRLRFRAAVRQAERNSATVDPMAFFDDYLSAGGNPQAFGRWARTLVRDATDTRSAAALRRNLETPRNQIGLWRYGAYGAWDVN